MRLATSISTSITMLAHNLEQYSVDVEPVRTDLPVSVKANGP